VETGLPFWMAVEPPIGLPEAPGSTVRRRPWRTSQ